MTEKRKTETQVLHETLALLVSIAIVVTWIVLGIWLTFPAEIWEPVALAVSISGVAVWMACLTKKKRCFLFPPQSQDMFEALSSFLISIRFGS